MDQNSFEFTLPDQKTSADFAQASPVLRQSVVLAVWPEFGETSTRNVVFREDARHEVKLRLALVLRSFERNRLRVVLRIDTSAGSMLHIDHA